MQSLCHHGGKYSVAHFVSHWDLSGCSMRPSAPTKNRPLGFQVLVTRISSQAFKGRFFIYQITMILSVLLRIIRILK